jgi:hypothetical protein
VSDFEQKMLDMVAASKKLGRQEAWSIVLDVLGSEIGPKAHPEAEQAIKRVMIQLDAAFNDGAGYRAAQQQKLS